MARPGQPLIKYLLYNDPAGALSIATRHNRGREGRAIYILRRKIYIIMGHYTGYNRGERGRGMIDRRPAYTQKILKICTIYPTIRIHSYDNYMLIYHYLTLLHYCTV